MHRGVLSVAQQGKEKGIGHFPKGTVHRKGTCVVVLLGTV
jgi:hypothetical protein